MAYLSLFALKCTGWLYFILPHFMKTGLARTLGFCLKFIGFRTAVIRQNLSYAFGQGEGLLSGLVTQSYIHLAHLVFEVSMILGPMALFVKKRGKVIGLEHYDQAVARGKGVIFLSSHVGNWEIMASIGALLARSDLLLVTKRLKPSWLHRAIQDGRRRCGVQATYEPRTLKDVLRHLREGKAVGFVLDQYSGPPVGVRVPVFGIPVGTSMVVAAVARRTGAPVLPIVNYRTPLGDHVVEVRPPLEWIVDEDTHYELVLNTARYASEIESHIRTHPDQWLWSHRRFKGDLSPIREGEWGAGRARA